MMMTMISCVKIPEMVLMQLIQLMELPVGVRHEQIGTKMYFGDDLKGTGTLYIMEEELIWMNAESMGINLPYSKMSTCGLAVDPQNFNEPCIVLSIENCEPDGSDNEEDNEECSVKFAPPTVADLRFLYDFIRKLWAEQSPPDEIYDEDAIPNYNNDSDADNDNDEEEEEAEECPNGFHNGNVEHQFDDD